MTERRRCWACHKPMDGPIRRRLGYHTCFECEHTWTWLGLVLADWRCCLRYWRSGWCWPRRPEVIFSCPCCAHDF